MISLGITGYVSLTSGNDIGQRRLKEIKKRSSVESSPRNLYIWHIYLFDSTEYHNLHHFQLRNHQRSPEVKEKVDKKVKC